MERLAWTPFSGGASALGCLHRLPCHEPHTASAHFSMRFCSLHLCVPAWPYQQKLAPAPRLQRLVQQVGQQGGAACSARAPTCSTSLMPAQLPLLDFRLATPLQLLPRSRSVLALHTDAS